MADESNAKIPRPLYAAAAVGDLAYQRLRRLPTAVSELRGRMAGAELDTDRLRDAAERVDRLRGAAHRNATALVNGAQAAQERAAAVYTDLVARGEQVVRKRRVVHATVGIVSQPGASQPGARPASAAAPEATASPSGPASDGKPRLGEPDGPGGSATATD